jgi:hypothetical protein
MSLPLAQPVLLLCLTHISHGVFAVLLGTLQCRDFAIVGKLLKRSSQAAMMLAIRNLSFPIPGYGRAS